MKESTWNELKGWSSLTKSVLVIWLLEKEWNVHQAHLHSHYIGTEVPSRETRGSWLAGWWCECSVSGCLIDLPGCLMVLVAQSRVRSNKAHWTKYAHSCIKQLQSLLSHWTRLSTCSINILTMFSQVRRKASSIVKVESKKKKYVTIHYTPSNSHTPSHTHVFPIGSIQRAKMRFLLLPAMKRPRKNPLLSTRGRVFMNWAMTLCSWDGK